MYVASLIFIIEGNDMMELLNFGQMTVFFIDVLTR